jgi:hypothetical protein
MNFSVTLNERYLRLFLVLFVVLLLQACSGSSSEKGEDVKSDYVIPSPSRPVTVEPKEVKVSPVAIEDYITNPGIGWQDGPDPYGVLGFPETVAYSYRRKISWAVLNPKEGEYDWSALDEQLAEAKKMGKQFSFRVYTMVGEDYDGQMIPGWVLDKGASLFPDGEPVYANCTYQEEWGRFVNELVKTYDGNPDVAFIDISGYGNFNEWSWQDQQTEWDDAWADSFKEGSDSPEGFTTLDGQARRRLADMFIGGKFQGHQCRTADGEKLQIDYSYDGFQKTQLLMPYAGIVQSAQYVFSRRTDVGFRYDCLGYDGRHVFEKLNNVLSQVWKTAPIVFELCKPDDVEVEDAKWLLEASHGSIVHNNNWKYDLSALEDMMRYAGYRYFLEKMEMKVGGRTIDAKMVWQNLGLAPSYPRMGQNFQLNFYLLDDYGKDVYSVPIMVDISSWKPADSLAETANGYEVAQSMGIPNEIKSGKYLAAVNILDLRTGKPIQLAMDGMDEHGFYVIAPIEIQ